MEKEVIKEKNELVENETVDKVKEKNKNSNIVKRIFNIFFWVSIIILAFIWVSDYARVRENKEAKYCISTKIHEFEDGSVKECIGLGYKTYKYERTSMSAGIEFGPFFMKMRK